jgi:hypothetical protein
MLNLLDVFVEADRLVEFTQVAQKARRLAFSEKASG